MGEATMKRRVFMNRNFLTNNEMKFGDQKKLDRIDESFSKLSQLQDRNFSVRDIRKEHYASPSNFKGIYNHELSNKMNSILNGPKTT